MHLPTLLSFGFAASVIALPNPVVRVRSVNDIRSAITSVKTSIDALDTAVRALNSSTDAAGLANIATKATAVGNVLIAAAAKVTNSDPIGAIGATLIQGAADSLIASVSRVSRDLVRKRPIIQQAGLAQVVSQMLTTQKTQSGGLVTAVSSKVPAFAKGLAAVESVQVNAALDAAIRAFSVNSTTAAPPATDGAPQAVPAPKAPSPAAPAVAPAPPVASPASVPAPAAAPLLPPLGFPFALPFPLPGLAAPVPALSAAPAPAADDDTTPTPTDDSGVDDISDTDTTSTPEVSALSFAEKRVPVSAEGGQLVGEAMVF